MKIPFDIKYRPQIESGEYKVETSSGKTVRIVCWDKKADDEDCIVALVTVNSDTERTVHFNRSGRCVSSLIGNQELFIITPEPELSEFEEKVRECVTKNLTTYAKDVHSMKMCSTVFIDDDTAKKMAAELLELAKKEVLNGLHKKVSNKLEMLFPDFVAPWLN